MDEPSDFPNAVAGNNHYVPVPGGGFLTLTTHGTQAMTVSGANAKALTGASLAAQRQHAATWAVYRSPEGHTIIAPNAEAAKRCTAPTHKTPGWEGHGAQAKDDPESNHFDTAMKRLEQAVERMHREMAGAKVATAITAIHNQMPRDGRPSRFIQETE